MTTGQQTSKFTYTRNRNLPDPNGSDERYGDASIQRLKFLLRNHRRAVDMFKTIRSWQHDQSVWAMDANNECGTVACAAGWVALTNILPGFQYTKSNAQYPWMSPEYDPVVNGERTSWDRANYQFFGQQTTHNIFWDTDLNRREILNRMRDRIQSLETALKSRGVQNP